MLYTQNTNFVVNTTGDNTCVQVNQSKNTRFFSSTLKIRIKNKYKYINHLFVYLSALLLASYQALTTNSALSLYTIAQIVNFSIPLIEDASPLYSFGFNISAVKFTNADQVWLVQTNTTTGRAKLDYVTLPVRLPSGEIADQPVNYFRNMNTRLSVSSSDILSVCSSASANTASLSPLSLAYYLPKADFQLLIVVSHFVFSFFHQLSRILWYWCGNFLIGFLLKRKMAAPPSNFYYKKSVLIGYNL